MDTSWKSAFDSWHSSEYEKVGCYINSCNAFSPAYIVCCVEFVCQHPIDDKVLFTAVSRSVGCTSKHLADHDRAEGSAPLCCNDPIWQSREEGYSWGVVWYLAELSHNRLQQRRAIVVCDKKKWTKSWFWWFWWFVMVGSTWIFKLFSWTFGSFKVSFSLFLIIFRFWGLENTQLADNCSLCFIFSRNDFRSCHRHGSEGRRVGSNKLWS